MRQEKDEMRMTPEEIRTERRRMDEKAKAEALASEDVAAHNYQRIRQLERRLEELNQAVTKLQVLEIGSLNRQALGLATTLSDARRDHTVLVGLVERMGEHLDVLAEWYTLTGPGVIDGRHFYTISGQREYDAAMHDAEGAPVTREDCVP